MRTTLNINDQLYREIKVRAAVENRTVTELIEAALLGFLGKTPGETTDTSTKRQKGVSFPVIEARKLKSVQGKRISIHEMDEKVKEVELSSEILRHEKTFGH